MKRFFLAALCAGTLCCLVGCEDKEAEAMQTQRIEDLSSEVNKLKAEADDLRRENVELKRKMGVVVDWISKRIAEKTKPDTKKATPSGTKASTPKKKTP